MEKRSLPKLFLFILLALVLSSCSQEIIHNHTFAQSWSFDSTHHWRSCSCGEKTDYSEHLWGEISSSADGKNYSTCQLCGYRKAVEPSEGDCKVKLVIGFDTPDQILFVQNGRTLTEPEENPGDKFDGFRFFWWSLSQGGEAFDFNTPITSDTTLYAVYRQLFTFVFYDRGNISSQTVAYGEEFSPNNNNLINEGYTLAYWSTDNNENHGVEKVDFPITVNSSKTFYSNWRKNVSVNFSIIDPENGNLKEVHTQTAFEGFPANNYQPQEVGFTLKGWSETGSIDNLFDFNEPVGTEDINLLPVWERNEYEVWIIYPEEEIVSTEVAYNRCVDKPEDPDYEGYTFVKWTYLKNIDSEKPEIIDFDFDTPITEDMLEDVDDHGKVLLIYALSDIESYTVSFDPAGGSDVPSQSVEYKQKVERPEDPTREGYTFKGWYLGNDPYSFDSEVKGALGLTARWEINKYTVTIISNGSTISTQTIEHGSKAEEVVPPARQYYFISESMPWYTGTENNKTAFSFDYAITGGTTVYVNWEASPEALFNITNDGVLTVKDGVTLPSELNIPSNVGGVVVTEIGEYAFGERTDLTSVTIPDSVTTIGFAAFYGCTSLVSVAIPDSVTNIGYAAFSACISLTNIDLDSENANYCLENGVLYNKSKTELICYPPCKTDTVFTIPNTVTRIDAYSFGYCSSLISVSIPDSVTYIDACAFISCTGLSSVVLPKFMTCIYSGAFSECTSLKSVTIPNSVTTIDKSAFYGCTSLTSVVIPDSVTSMDSGFYKCTGLISVTIPPSIIRMPCGFDGCTSLTDINFSGTIAQWNGISKEQWFDWNKDVPATVVHCTDGDVSL